MTSRPVQQSLIEGTPEQEARRLIVELFKAWAHDDPKLDADELIALLHRNGIRFKRVSYAA